MWLFHFVFAKVFHFVFAKVFHFVQKQVLLNGLNLLSHLKPKFRINESVMLNKIYQCHLKSFIRFCSTASHSVHNSTMLFQPVNYHLFL
jgi:hypothetical protein